MAVADFTYWNHRIDFKGVDEFSAYFRDVDTSGMSPALDYSTNNYECKICLQKWYLELTPEESQWPIFAFKDSTGTLTPQSNAVKAQKQFLRILAHCGFSTERCLRDSCDGFALNGMYFCHVHMG